MAGKGHIVVQEVPLFWITQDSTRLLWIRWTCTNIKRKVETKEKNLLQNAANLEEKELEVLLCFEFRNKESLNQAGLPAVRGHSSITFLHWCACLCQNAICNHCRLLNTFSVGWVRCLFATWVPGRPTKEIQMCRSCCISGSSCCQAITHNKPFAEVVKSFIFFANYRLESVSGLPLSALTPDKIYFYLDFVRQLKTNRSTVIPAQFKSAFCEIPHNSNKTPTIHFFLHNPKEIARIETAWSEWNVEGLGVGATERERQTDTQTDRQTDRETDRDPQTNLFWCQVKPNPCWKNRFPRNEDSISDRAPPANRSENINFLPLLKAMF